MSDDPQTPIHLEEDEWAQRFWGEAPPPPARPAPAAVVPKTPAGGRRLGFRALAVVLVATGAAAVGGWPAQDVVVRGAVPRYVCLPSCSESDGRFLAIATGHGADTVTGASLSIELAAAATASDLELSIFDGETGGWWDQGRAPLHFQIVADPRGDGTGNVVVMNIPGNRLLDNGWYSVKVPAVREARALSGHHYFTLHVTSPDPGVLTSSVFKVRTNGTMAIRPQPFSFGASVISSAEASVLYPHYPELDATRYDGSWSFFVRVPIGPEAFELWDGDFDFGSSTCTERDTDDSDTNPDGPGWDRARLALQEGVAVGHGAPCGIVTGYPADNDSASVMHSRAPSVRYSVVTPDGTRFENVNPSGNREWERFSVATSPLAVADRHTTALDAGLYRVDVVGLDLGNLAALRFAQPVLGIDSTGMPFSMPPVQDQRASRRGLLKELEQRKGTSVERWAAAVTRAIVHLERSLADEWWSDDDHPRKDRVFFESREALQLLVQLTRERTNPQWLSGFADRVTDLDRRLAEFALNEARGRQVDDQLLRGALERYEAGTKLSALDPVQAQEAFASAWHMASKF